MVGYGIKLLFLSIFLCPLPMINSQLLYQLS